MEKGPEIRIIGKVSEEEKREVRQKIKETLSTPKPCRPVPPSLEKIQEREKILEDIEEKIWRGGDANILNLRKRLLLLIL